MNWALSGCEPRVLIADLFRNFFLPLWELLDYSFLPVVKQIYNS